MPRVLAVLALAALAIATAALGATTRAAAPKKLRVGLVTDIGGLNDRGFNHLSYVGLLRAEKTFGVEGRVLTSSGPNDYIPNLSSLAKQGYDVVIGVGFLMESAMQAVAAKFPNVKFAGVDIPAEDLADKKTKKLPKNFQGLLFREQEVGYLVGYLAALEAKRRQGNPVVSAVGGIEVPAVDRYIAGYQAGASAAVGGTKVLYDYAQSFTDQAKCKELALDQIAAGSSVVFAVAGACGLGSLDAAREKHVWGIGVDADQSFLGPHILTSAQKKVDVAVFDEIKAASTGKFRGGTDAVFGVKQGGVGFGKFSKRANAADVRRALAIVAKIRAGQIKSIPTVPKKS